MNPDIQKVKKALLFVLPAIGYLFLFGKYFFGDTYLFGFAEWYSPYSVDHAWDYFFKSLFLYSDNNWGIPQYYPSINIFNFYRWIMFLVFGVSLGQKVIILSLFYFSFFGSFLFLKTITKEKKFSYILSIIFSLNPFILSHFVFGHHVLIISMFQLLLSGHFLIKFYENKDKLNLIWVVILFSINPIHPLYIPFYLFLYFLIGLYKKINFLNNVKYLLLILIMFFLLNASWTLNLVFGSKSVGEVLDYRVSDMERLAKRSRPILNSFLNSEYYNEDTFLNNNANAKSLFDLSSILIWILIASAMLKSKIADRRVYLFLLAVALALMVLLTGSFNPFGKELFEKIYNLKVYQLYREIYHFTFLLIPILFFLLAILYSNIKNKNILKQLFLGVVVISLFFRVLGVSEYSKLPTLSKKIYTSNAKDMAENADMYKFICDKYNTGQYIFFLPFYYTTHDLRTGAKDTEGGADLFLARNCVATIGNGITLTTPYEKILKVFDKNEYNSTLFSRAGIEYVIFRKDFISSNENAYSTDLVRHNIESDSNFKFIEENKNFIVYKNNYNEGLLKSSNLSFEKINPTKFRLFIKNIKNYQSLFFYEIYNTNWEIFLSSINPNESCTAKTFYENSNLTECQHEEKYFEGEELSYLWKKPIFDDTHKLVNEYANKWTIDPEYIKQNFSKEYYKENSDGSIDVEMVLYFKPQSYFYLGLIISGTTLLSCLGYLLYDWRKRRKLIKKEQRIDTP